MDSHVKWPYMQFIISCSLLAVTLAVGGGAAVPPPDKENKVDRFAAVRSITGAYPKLSATERVDRFLSLFKEEMASPIKPYFGTRGGPIDTGWIRGLIMGSVCTFGEQGTQRQAIRDVLADKLKQTPADDAYMRDVLTIMLAYAGDTGTIASAVRIMETHPEGYMRTEAAYALRDIAGPAQIPALRRVLKSDTYARVKRGSDGRKPIRGVLVYGAVRRVASEILMRLGERVEPGADLVDGKYAVERIKPLLSSSDSKTACEAVYYLEHIGGPESLEALNTFVTGSSPGTAPAAIKEAKAALSRMCGFGP